MKLLTLFVHELKLISCSMYLITFYAKIQIQTSIEISTGDSLEESGLQSNIVNKMVLINMLYKRGKNRQIVKLDILNQFQRNLHGIIHRSP